jgi:protein-S-isoprenylcysteine O-methyltransferase Ste14
VSLPIPLLQAPDARALRERFDWLLQWKWADKTFAILLLSGSLVAKWFAGLLDSPEDWYSFMGSLTTAALLYALISSAPPRKVYFHWTTLVAIVLSVLPSYLISIISPTVPVTVLKAICFCKCFYELILIASYVTIGKNFGMLPGYREIETRGPYRYLRHPIYGCYIHLQLLFCLVAFNAQHFLLLAAVAVGAAIRIVQEERLLMDSKVYRDYRQGVCHLIFRPIFSAPLMIFGIYVATLH